MQPSLNGQNTVTSSPAARELSSCHCTSYDKPLKREHYLLGWLEIGMHVLALAPLPLGVLPLVESSNCELVGGRPSDLCLLAASGTGSSGPLVCFIISCNF